jgi:type II secretory pathway pseudopilin PulG
MMRKVHGFTYLAILFAVAIISITLTGTISLWSIERQRDKEQELIFVGDQFRQAIGHYYENSPGAVKQFPTSLADLLSDNRFSTIQRHLRRIYLDPISGTYKWGLVMTPGGGIIGVYSPSNASPIKRAEFAGRDEQFVGKTRYSEWKFVYEKGFVKNAPAIFLRVQHDPQ